MQANRYTNLISREGNIVGFKDKWNSSSWTVINMDLPIDPNVSRAESENNNNSYGVIRVDLCLLTERQVPRFPRNGFHYFHWLRLKTS
jgi:hypothetical protein